MSMTGESFSTLDDMKIPLAQFVDVNLSGMPDIVFYHNEKVYVIYNHLESKTFNEGTIDDSQNLCRDQTNVVETQIFTNYTEDIQQGKSSRDITFQEIAPYVNDGFSIVDIANPLSQEQFAGKEGLFQGRLRYGDMNIDGYPDLFLTLVVQSDDTQEKEYQSLLLVSASCTEELCPDV